MNVLYLSKALTVGAYRGKVDALAAHVRVRGVFPARWGRDPVEPVKPRASGGTRMDPWPAWFHGHNHVHLYRRVGRMLDSGPADLVHIDEEPYSAVTLQLMRACNRRRIPSVFFAWQNLEKRLPPPFGVLRTAVFRGAAGAIAGTADAAAVLRRAGYAGPLAVIPQFGVDPAHFAPRAADRSGVRRLLGVTDGEVLIGYGGRLVTEKGVHLLLDAVASIERARLVLIGAGPERPRLERQARMLGLTSRVRFAGHRPSAEMPDWLAACDVVVLPSVGRRGWIEQFGRILVEAMACGVAVVGSRCGEIPRVIGDAGAVVPANDTGALAAALGSLAASPAKRASLAGRGRARVLEHFTHARIAERTASFYHEVLARPARERPEAYA